MKIRITLELSVDDTPVADAITYFVRKYGIADPDDWHSPEEWAEMVVLDQLDPVTLKTETMPEYWRIERSFVERIDNG